MISIDFQEFRKYYNQTIHPELSRLETQRVRLITLIGLSLLGILLLLLVGIYFNSLLLVLYIILVISAYIIFLYIKVLQFIKTFKPKVVNLILLFIKRNLAFEDFQYDSQQTISKNTFDQSSLFHESLDLFRGEDYISGRIVTSDFEMSELEVARQSKVQPKLEPIFKGIFIRAKIASMVQEEGRVFIYPQGREPYLIRTMQTLHRKGLKAVAGFTLDPKFAATFRVFSKDRAYLDTYFSKHVQREILNFSNNSTQNLYLSLENDTLYLGMEQAKDILEPKLFQTNIDYKQTESFLRDVLIIFELIYKLDGYN